MTRVLVVDDKEENLYYLQVLLEAHDCVVEFARHGAEALIKARQAPPDLVISDLLMPVMDGYTLLRYWKADARLKAVPFVVYTATYTEADDERLAMNLGADAFILKPAEPDVFLTRLQQVRDNAAAAVSVHPGHAPEDEEVLLKGYSETLIRKLEEKTLQLQEANVALQQDIADRKTAKDQLEQGAALLRIAGRVARLGGWSWQVGDDAVRWSDETCAIHEMPQGHRPTLDEAIRFYAPEYRDAVRDSVAACIKDGAPLDLEAQIITASGRRAWVRAIGEAARDDGGAVGRVQGAFQDITEQKRLEQQFLRAQRMEGIGTLAGGIAHDLNNVLVPIMLSIELLRPACTDAESQETLDLIAASAQRGADMVRQVLSFARGIEGRRVSLDVRPCVRDVVKLIGETFPKDIRIIERVATDVWMIDADPTQVHQVLLNLCVNARDAMPHGGQIVLAAENTLIDAHYAAMNLEAKAGRYVMLDVEDTGAGIPHDIIEKIFDPFFTTKDVGKGTGLGLATTMAIVKGHGGFMRVHRDVGVGTRFRIYLPAVAGAWGAETIEAPVELPRGNGETILVVDDEPSIRQITKQTLEAYGYRVKVAADGSEAISVYVQHQQEIRVVLTDMMMPVMDGPATIQVLLRLNPGLRIIGASGIDQIGKVALAAGAGVKAFLPKPYTADTLLKTLRRVLE